jgi:hypothetical protein
MTDLTAILCEIRELREIIAGLQPSTPTCSGVTGKGTPCRNRAIGDSGVCRMHGERPERPPRVPKAKAPPKPKKVQPEHTHTINEVPAEPCPLCLTHGDVWDPMLPEYKFCV